MIDQALQSGSLHINFFASTFIMTCRNTLLLEDPLCKLYYLICIKIESALNFEKLFSALTLNWCIYLFSVYLTNYLTIG